MFSIYVIEILKKITTPHIYLQLEYRLLFNYTTIIETNSGHIFLENQKLR